jgi:hypothetical protein
MTTEVSEKLLKNARISLFLEKQKNSNNFFKKCGKLKLFFVADNRLIFDTETK